MASWTLMFGAVLGLYLQFVSSLDCYSCFSWKSNVECESQHSLKKITCRGDYDTCLKYEMKIRIRESINGNIQYVNNPAYARYCGKKKDCRTQPQVCRHTFKHDGDILECKITCCDEDIETSKCHETPHWPGNSSSSSVVTSKYTGNVGKGARGSGVVNVPTSIWFMFITEALIRMFV